MDPNQPSAPRSGDKTPVLIGVVLIVVGTWLFAKPFIMATPLWGLWQAVRGHSWPVVLILAGAALVVFASRGDRPQLPAKGARLYRRRDDKWVSGVLGGIARYFGIDAVALRLGYLAVAVIFGVWQAVVAYFIASWVMPEEPAPTTYVPPQPPVT